MGTWTNPQIAKHDIEEALVERPDLLSSLKLTVYEKSYKTGMTVDYSLSGQEIVDALKE